MLILKKLLFAPFFLLFFYLSLHFFTVFLGNTDIFVAFKLSLLQSYVLLAICIFLTALFFGIFSSLTNSWVYVLPTVVLAALISFLLPGATILIASVGAFLALLIGFTQLFQSLKSYLTFKPNDVIGGSIRTTSKLLVLGLTITYLVSVKTSIDKNGFQIPSSIIDTALKFSPVQDQPQTQSSSTPTPTLPAISQEELNFAKQNPELLKQYGIDPKILDQLDTPKTQPATTRSDRGEPSAVSPQPTADLSVRGLVNNELQSMVKPYLSFIPLILSFMFLAALYTFLEILLVLLSPTLWLIFKILEKTNFIHFEKEMREVQKMVV